MGREEIIFTREELSRITKDIAMNTITVDVHGMSCHDAWWFVHNIVALHHRDQFSIVVIHGYNGGVSIKKTLWDRPVSVRVQRMQSCFWNPGVTTIMVA